MAHEEIQIIEAQEETELKGVELLANFFDADGATAIPKPNIADMLTKQTLMEIGKNVINGYEADLDSMSDWADYVEIGMKLVKQEKNAKSTPWDGAANFKSPTLMQAALKFSDRASTELLRQEDILKTTVIGKDLNGEKAKQAERVAEYSNYQLNVEMDEWRDEHEKLLYKIPYDGTVFKKTFFDFRLGRPVSNVITYPDFVVSNTLDSISRLRRFSETIELSENEVTERKRQGIWSDVELSLGTSEATKEQETEAEADKMTTFTEQQGYFDLDGDGYEEPYTFVVDKNSQTVVRIIARFELSDVLIKNKSSKVSSKLSESIGGSLKDFEVVRVKAVSTITKYGFLRDPEGGFLDVGYSYILGALTNSINATTNQLVDAGTLANRQGGWLAKGFSRKMGNSSFKPGEWKQTGISAQDLQTGVVPLPIREPSGTLFSLMQYMISSSQELSASADLTQALGANAPATTTLALVQEQQQSAGAIILRIYRAMSSEFKKLFIINSKFLDPEEYQEVLDDPEASFENDFNVKSVNIIPIANPEISSKIQRIQQAQAELSQVELVSLAGGDIRVIVKNFYEAIGAQNIDEIFPDLGPQEQLQKLLSENPDLAEMLAGETERMDLIAASEADKIEREQEREDLKVAMGADKTQSDIDINNRKLEQSIDKDDADFGFRLTELEQAVGKDLNAEVQSNMLIFDPATGEFE